MSTTNFVETENFSQRLRKFRKAKGLTLQQLAVLIGVSTTNVADAEKGTQPSYKFFFGFAKIWPGDIVYLLTGKHPETIVIEDEMERKVIYDYRKLSDKDKSIVKDVIESIVKEA